MQTIRQVIDVRVNVTGIPRDVGLFFTVQLVQPDTAGIHTGMNKNSNSSIRYKAKVTARHNLFPGEVPSLCKTK